MKLFNFENLLEAIKDEVVINYNYETDTGFNRTGIQISETANKDKISVVRTEGFFEEFSFKNNTEGQEQLKQLITKELENNWDHSCKTPGILNSTGGVFVELDSEEIQELLGNCTDEIYEILVGEVQTLGYEELDQMFGS